jgi:hypothetical protein
MYPDADIFPQVVGPGCCGQTGKFRTGAAGAGFIRSPVGNESAHKYNVMHLYCPFCIINTYGPRRDIANRKMPIMTLSCVFFRFR